MPVFYCPIYICCRIYWLTICNYAQLEQFIYKDALNVQPLNNEIYPLSQQIESAREVMPVTAQITEVRPSPSPVQTTRLFFPIIHTI